MILMADDGKSRWLGVSFVFVCWHNTITITITMMTHNDNDNNNDDLVITGQGLHARLVSSAHQALKIFLFKKQKHCSTLRFWIVLLHQNSLSTMWFKTFSLFYFGDLLYEALNEVDCTNGQTVFNWASPVIHSHWNGKYKTSAPSFDILISLVVVCASHSPLNFLCFSSFKNFVFLLRMFEFSIWIEDYCAV